MAFLDFDMHEARLIAALDGDRLHSKFASMLIFIFTCSSIFAFALPKKRGGYSDIVCTVVSVE